MSKQEYVRVMYLVAAAVHPGANVDQAGAGGHSEQQIERITEHHLRAPLGWMFIPTIGLGSWWPDRRMIIYPGPIRRRSSRCSQ